MFMCLDLMKTSVRLLVMMTTACFAAAGCGAQDAPKLAPRFLTSGTGFSDYWPCFSPDGTKVLFSRRVNGNRTWKLWIVGADGTEPHLLAGDALPISATRANWSFHGNLIALTGISDSGKTSVWIIKPDGTPVEPQPAGLPEGLFYPSWYPSGDALAAMDGHTLEIKRVDLKQGTAGALTSRDRILTGMPSVSPDGNWIAFAGQLNKGQKYDQSQNGVWLLDVHSGMVHSLEPTPLQGRAPSWSPDSKKLAFESNRGNPLGRYAVFTINRDGTGLQQVTSFEWNATHPVWSPNGQELVFAALGSWLSKETKIALVTLPPG